MTSSELMIYQERDDCLPIISELQTDFQSRISIRDIYYQEVLLLSQTNLYISDFKKFTSETQAQQYDNTLILPRQNPLFYLSVGYLHLLAKNHDQAKINRLKQMIIDCDFEKYRQNGQQLFQLVENGTNFKVIGIKIINAILQSQSVYELLLDYDVDAFLEFIFRCILELPKQKKSFQQNQVSEKLREKFNFKILKTNQKNFEFVSNEERLFYNKNNQGKIQISIIPYYQIKFIRRQ